MPIRQSEILEWQKDESIMIGGGHTNWICTTKYPDELVAYCGRVRRVQDFKGDNPSGEKLYCSRPAGWGTSHLGTGACKVHAGLSGTHIPITTGADAGITRNKFKHKVEAYMQKDKQELVDITFELASLRVIAEQMVENFAEADPDDMVNFRADVSRMQSLVSTIGSLVDKINRIDARNALTVGQILYLKARIEYIFTKYIKDPRDRTNAFKELQSSIPDNVESDLLIAGDLQ